MKLSTSNSTLIVFGFIIYGGLQACGKKTNHPKDEPVGDTEFTESNSEKTGTFRGYVITNQILTDRLSDETHPVDLAIYLEKKETGDAEPDIFAEFAPSLKDLLGKNEGNGLTSEFKNSRPNTFNMLVWYIALSGLSTDASKICAEPDSEKNKEQSITLNQHATEAFKNLCSWPSPSARSPEALSKLWMLLMKFDAPNSDYKAWEAFALSSELNDLTAEQASINLVLAALYNPYFLINQ